MATQIKANSGNKYILGRELGRGSFGTVYLGSDPQGNEVAVKLIGPTSNEDEKTFERELEGALAVFHTNVLKLIDFGRHEINGQVYLFTVTEFCEGGDFRNTVSGYSRTPLAGHRIQSDFDQLLLGLSALHDKLVHRDLKPENVFLKGGGTLKVGDFGFAKLVDQATASLTFKGSGSPAYMAPEVWDRKRATVATDLYAVGVMLFEAYTGRRPFSAPDIMALRDEHRFAAAPRAKAINPEVPDRIDGIIKRLLDKEATKRYASAKELRIALQDAGSPPKGEGIGSIVRGIRAHADATEAAELTMKQRADEERAEIARIRYMENDLLGQFDEVVAEVNSQLPEAQIARSVHYNGRTFGLGHRQLHVQFFNPGDLYRDPKVPGRMDVLRRKNAVHGGIVEIQQNGSDQEGWNIVLVRAPEETYGTWLLVESRPSALSSMRARYEPVATQVELFADNLACHWNRAMHVWNLKDKPLERDDIVSILHALVSPNTR